MLGKHEIFGDSQIMAYKPAFRIRRKSVGCWFGIGLLLVSIIGHWPSQADSSSVTGPQWAAPSAMALRQVNSVAEAQDEPDFLENLDCTTTTYRLPTSSTMQTGCFSNTALGLMDSDSYAVIFNGTDEALPLIPYNAHDTLVPWPGALDLLRLTPNAVNGSLVSIYTDPLAVIKDQRDEFGRLIAKQLTTAADKPLYDQAGRPLAINPQTLAFSSNGSWLVAETIYGVFVRINLATLDVTAFAPAYSISGNPAALKSQVTISDDGRFVAIHNDNASEFQVYDITSCLAASSSDQPELCPHYNYQTFINHQISGLHYLQHLRFINDGLLSFVAGAESGDGSYVLAPTATITSLTDYLALGDSYSSGEGAFDYRDGTDTADNRCHLSVHAYPQLLTHDLFTAVGGHSVACSGAVINDLGSTSDSYHGQMAGVADWQQLQIGQASLLDSVMTNFLPGYVAQQRFVQQYQPAVITVGVGGNDIGFGNILETCVEPHLSLHLSSNSCYGTYEDRQEVLNLIDRTRSRWTDLFQHLQVEAPFSRIYAIGYPQIAVDNGSCGLNVHLSQAELEFTDELIVYLNNAIAQSAAQAHVHYVDISKALAGHRLCETSSDAIAMNGLTAGTDSGIGSFKFLGQESYHPNALGQALIEQAILTQTHNLSDDSSLTTPPGDNSSSILSVPKTGRPIATLIPSQQLTTLGVAAAGSQINIHVDGTTAGLPANGSFTVHIGGASGPVIGTASSGNSGDISTVVTIPTSTAPGGTTIDVTGQNETGDPVHITQPIIVPVSSTDSDGDGIPDDKDSCPFAPNSGIDSNHNGIDDVCDSALGTNSSDSGSASPGSTGNDSNNTTSNNNTSGSNGGHSNDSGSTTPSTSDQTNSPSHEQATGSTTNGANSSANSSNSDMMTSSSSNAVSPIANDGTNIISDIKTTSNLQPSFADNGNSRIAVATKLAFSTAIISTQLNKPVASNRLITSSSPIIPQHIMNLEPHSVVAQTFHWPGLPCVNWLPWALAMSSLLVVLLIIQKLLDIKLQRATRQRFKIKRIPKYIKIFSL